jgi:hypothetical protein
MRFLGRFWTQPDAIGMKYDDRSEADPIRREQFIAWLVETTVNDFVRCRSNRDRLRTAVFLFLNRAYEAHLDPYFVVELLGIRSGNVITSAGLDETDEAVVMECYERLDATTLNVYEEERSGRV